MVHQDRQFYAGIIMYRSVMFSMWIKKVKSVETRKQCIQRCLSGTKPLKQLFPSATNCLPVTKAYRGDAFFCLFFFHPTNLQVFFSSLKKIYSAKLQNVLETLFLNGFYQTWADALFQAEEWLLISKSAK